MDKMLALFLYRYLSSVSSGCIDNQAWELLFSCVPGLTRSHELAL
jgi:hypothetical protein